ncbi:phage head closure protein [Brevibacillus sp. MER 51]|uniref:phage head closure protein n=1 Tax=Brevibacillus sp. MER 51 TaxID=2939560 RepID=UPI00203CAADC|nr:phage head closure protein [Brevibacillus sp. MER 51]MCM3145375.1 phage head closure protein [Brevibacillus sp. MER 51]
MKQLVNRLNKRITIRKQTWEKNSMNERKQSWTDYAKVWAAIEPLRGQESFVAQKSESTVTTRIRIRFREGIEPSMMIDYRGISFEIMYIIQPEFNKRELQLMCKERR